MATNRLAVGSLAAADQPNRDGDIRLQPQAGDPTTWPAGTIGQFAYSSSANNLYHYGGSGWVAAASAGLKKVILSPIWNNWTNEPYARDGDSATYASSSMDTSNNYMTYDLGSVKQFMVVLRGYTHIRTQGVQGPVYAYLHIETSNDNVTYKTIDTSFDLAGAQFSGANQSRSDTVTALDTGRYIRIYGWGGVWGSCCEAYVWVYEMWVITN